MLDLWEQSVLLSLLADWDLMSKSWSLPALPFTEQACWEFLLPPSQELEDKVGMRYHDIRSLYRAQNLT